MLLQLRILGLLLLRLLLLLLLHAAKPKDTLCTKS
jgi:hypothetical protein